MQVQACLVPRLANLVSPTRHCFFTRFRWCCGYTLSIQHTIPDTPILCRGCCCYCQCNCSHASCQPVYSKIAAMPCTTHSPEVSLNLQHPLQCCGHPPLLLHVPHTIAAAVNAAAAYCTNCTHRIQQHTHLRCSQPAAACPQGPGEA
jgi:hypothetical protein